MARADHPTRDADGVPLLYLDGTGWRDVLDFCEALYDLVGGPRPAACSVQAVAETLVATDVRLKEPPYRVLVTSLSDPDLREFVALCGHWTEELRRYFNQLNGEDVRVSLELSD